MKQLVIADLGTGNLRSVSNAIRHVSGKLGVTLSGDAQTIRSADMLVLPGQGAIGTWFAQVNREQNLEAALRDRLANVPVLGICLGLQALFESSAEDGGVRGLGLLAGDVVRFDTNDDPSLKIPHMGWNQVEQVQDHPLWQGIGNHEYFYFVHSYYARAADSDQVFGQCNYGLPFTAAAGKDNFFATQFHPEKSHRAGLKLLENFVNWNGDTNSCC